MAETFIDLPSILRNVTAPTSMTLTMTNVVGSSTSPFTLNTQTYEFPGERIDISVTMGVMAEVYFQAWQAIFLRLKGTSGTFNLPFSNWIDETSNKSHMYSAWPSAYGIIQAPSGSVGNIGDSYVRAEFLRGSSTADVGSHSTAFKAGEWLYIDWAGEDGTQSIHRVLEDSGTDGNGFSTLRIWPSLRKEKTTGSNNSFIRRYGDITVRMEENSFSFTKTADGLFRISFSVVEAL